MAAESRRARCSCRSTASAPSSGSPAIAAGSWTLGEAAYLAFKGPRRVVPLFSTAGRSRRGAAPRRSSGSPTPSTRSTRGEFPPTPDDVYRCETCSSRGLPEGLCRRRLSRGCRSTTRPAVSRDVAEVGRRPTGLTTPRARARRRSVAERRARGVGRHRQDARAGRALRQPAARRRRARPHPRDHVHAQGRRRDARAHHRAAAGSEPPVASSTRRGGASSRSASATSRSRRSTRSACRCCASFRSRPTSIPGSTWPTTPRCRA